MSWRCKAAALPGRIPDSHNRAGFTKRDESEYDPFGAGHSSTSISAALGMAVGRDVKGKKNSVIAVIGDGAITGGMAYEAMNHAGFLDKNMIVILNDNQQARRDGCARVEGQGCVGKRLGFGCVPPSLETQRRSTLTATALPCCRVQVSLPTQYNNKNQDPVGALSSALARLQANRPLRELREIAKVRIWVAATVDSGISPRLDGRSGLA